MILEVHRHYLLKTISQNDSGRKCTLSKCLKYTSFTTDIWFLQDLEELTMHLKFTGLENLGIISSFFHEKMSVFFMCIKTLMIYSFHRIFLSFDLYEHDFFIG